MRILIVYSGNVMPGEIIKRIEKYSESSGNEIFVDAFNSAEARGRMEKYEIIMLAPQLSVLKNDFERIAGSKQCVVIPARDYATGNAQNIYELAEKHIKNA